MRSPCWSPEPNLTARFTAARQVARTTWGLSRLVAATYQAFLKLLRAGGTGGLSTSAQDRWKTLAGKPPVAPARCPQTAAEGGRVRRLVACRRTQADTRP